MRIRMAKCRDPKIPKDNRWIEKVTVKIKGSFVPEYQTPYSAGCDLCADIDDCVIVKPGEFFVIPTGISIEIPSGYEAQIRPRSGIALKYGVGILNTPGTIDADYRGEIRIILFNFGKKNFVIKRGDRIAQMVFARVVKAEFRLVKKLNETRRGSGGFGHTGGIC